MRRSLAAVLLALCLCQTSPAQKFNPYTRRYTKRNPYLSDDKKDPHNPYWRSPCLFCRHSSQKALELFLQQSGYPNGRPGYVVDHVIPLGCNGADDSINMQWLTIEDAKVKGDWTAKNCVWLKTTK